MYRIAAAHPIALRRFSTRQEAVRIAGLWGFGPWRIYLNVFKD
jgi:hypothetical protein